MFERRINERNEKYLPVSQFPSCLIILAVKEVVVGGPTKVAVACLLSPCGVIMTIGGVE